MIQRLEAQGNEEGQKKWDDGSDHDDVTKITLRGDSEGINYIRFDYIKSGTPKYGSFHGLTNQGLTQTFEIDHLNGEQLESIEGYYKPKTSTILGLQFKTNLRISPLIGYTKNGTKFSLAVDGKKIIGLHGSSASKLNSLGAYFTWINSTRLEAKGGKGGIEWDDGANHEGITKIYVRGGCGGIQYIKFDYVKDGQHIYGSTHGAKDQGFTEPFEINHLNKEYLVSVEGYYDKDKPAVIQGLQFKTNIKTSELMGYNTGKKFRLSANGRKIIGFHGFAEKNLNSLGAYFTTLPFTKLEYIGAATARDHWDDGTFDGIRKVYVNFDDSCIRCLRLDYDNKGKIERLEHGTMTVNEGEFVVDYPYEFVTSVEGTLKTEGYKCVASLTFKTSKGRTSPTFGSVTKSKFVLESKGCALVGFHGRSGASIGAIGAYFCPMPILPDAEKLEAQGGVGGASWDDGDFDGIRNIYIGLSELGIAFVKFVYDKDNHALVGDDHGIKTMLEVDEFELKHSSEYLISVEGYYEILEGSDSEVIRMLKFKTNMQNSQVFGLSRDSNFTLEKKCHKIVGFHGKVSNMLNQIGVHVLPIIE